jgi:hypothetical protein
MHKHTLPNTTAACHLLPLLMLAATQLLPAHLAAGDVLVRVGSQRANAPLRQRSSSSALSIIIVITAAAMCWCGPILILPVAAAEQAALLVIIAAAACLAVAIAIAGPTLLVTAADICEMQSGRQAGRQAGKFVRWNKHVYCLLCNDEQS